MTPSSTPNMAARIGFIRHADALPEADEVVLGHYDEQSLSQLGRRPAQA